MINIGLIIKEEVNKRIYFEAADKLSKLLKAYSNNMTLEVCKEIFHYLAILGRVDNYPSRAARFYSELRSWRNAPTEPWKVKEDLKELYKIPKLFKEDPNNVGTYYSGNVGKIGVIARRLVIPDYGKRQVYHGD